MRQAIGALALATVLALIATGPALADRHGDHGDNSQSACSARFGNTGSWYGANSTGERGDHQGYNNQGNEGRDDNSGSGWYGCGRQREVRGIITAVGSNAITIMQGLEPIRIDLSRALNRRRIYAPLYLSRTITAMGYFDRNGTFHATAVH
ncbi:MAG: hypothetical protein ACYDHD_08270 [Vulcanimicrobiaceae bacterium]